MRSKGLLAVVVPFALALLVSPPASAQLAAPNANGVAIGHVHVNAVDLEAQTRFWTLLGGKIVQRDKLTLVQYPGIYVILRVQAPSGGTVGSRLNHFGFLVKDFAGSVAKWKAAGLNWEPVINPQVGQGFLMGPDDVRVEIYEDTSIASPFTMHHIHLLVPDPPAAQRWYIQHFGATAGTRLGGTGLVRTQFATVNVPGTEITLSLTKESLAPTKGRSVDHIGFEVKDIDKFVAQLRTAGLKTDGEIRSSSNASGLRLVYLTDPWGTEIEITQGLAATGPGTR